MEAELALLWFPRRSSPPNTTSIEVCLLERYTKIGRIGGGNANTLVGSLLISFIQAVTWLAARGFISSAEILDS